MSVHTSSEPLTRFERWPGIMGLAFGLVAGPVAALLMQTTAYNAVHWACGHKSMPAVHVIPVIYVLVGVAALWMSWRDWTSVGRIVRAEGGTVPDRTRFIALLGVILSAYSLVIMLWMWAPMVIFDPCQR
jgi:hypothetical protein